MVQFDKLAERQESRKGDRRSKTETVVGAERGSGKGLSPEKWKELKGGFMKAVRAGKIS